MFGFVRTIRFRLTLWFVSILALVILAVSGLLYFGLERVLLQSVDSNLHNAGMRSVAPASGLNTPSPTAASDEIRGFPENEQNDQLLQLMLLSNTPARLLALDGTLLQEDPLFPRGISVTQAQMNTASNGTARYETVVVGTPTHAYRLYTAPVRMNEVRTAIVQVADSLDEELRTLADVRTLLLWLIPLSLIFAAIGGSFLAGRALSPMTHVRREVETIIEKSDLSHRVSTGLPDDEVGRLARTFDRLLDRVQQAMARERQFTSDASHELRTPLTVLKGVISVALSRPRSNVEYRDSLAVLESTVDDMSQVVEDLLLLTRSADSKQPMTLAPIHIADLVKQTSERMQVIAAPRGVTLHPPSLEDGGDLYVLGDRIRLQRVFTNLIDNAVRYTPKGGQVDITMRRDGASVSVEVQDTGRGISPEHLPNLFQRFYRADSGRSRDSGGTGLGLAIAQTITRAHGGRITVSSRPGRGTCFTVLLPVTQPPVTPSPQQPSPVQAAQIDSAKTPSLAERANGKTGIPISTERSVSPNLHSRSFRAMNTDIALFLLSQDLRHANCVLDAAEWFFLQVEWRLSRFRESSELSLLNRQGTTQASRMLYDVLQLAAQANRDTAGIFNPLIRPALVAAGYDRTFDEIGTDQVIQVYGRGAAIVVPAFSDAVILDPVTHQVSLQHGAQVDLGGIAKGWAIDRAYRTLSKLGPCCVNAGGDVRVGGSFQPGGSGWQVDIEDPFTPDSTADSSSQAGMHSVMLKDHAIATSGIVKRRWVVNGTEQHHLIDPRTGEPARNELLFVSAIADTAVLAEVAAKTIFIQGPAEGSAWAEARHIPALLMFRNGEYQCNPWFPITGDGHS